MKRFLLALLVIILIQISGFSQTTDFGIWYAARGSLPITRYLDFNLEGDIRTFQDASKIDEGFGEAGLTMHIFRFLSVAASYRLTSKIEDDNNYYLRHKFFAYVKGKTDINRVGLSCMLKYERQVKTYIKNPDDEVPDNYGRVKLEAKYNIRNSKFEPVVYCETFSRIFEATEKPIEKYRLSAGTTYKFSNKHKVEISYIFERDFLPHLHDMNIISLSYDFKI
jgi:hypothetical protein